MHHSDMNLDILNDMQRQAVLCTDVPSLVIAGAGSGKTRVLTTKIAYLINQGINPWNIVALTFTNKAANEMKERIATMVESDSLSRLWMGTFHSVFSRILRIESQYIHFSSRFTIYDALDSKNMIKRIIQEKQLDDKKYKPSVVANMISEAKNHLLLPPAYKERNAARDSNREMPLVASIYEEYFRRCQSANVMDFDDILLYTWLLLKNNPEVLQKYEEQFHYILVDEYQDTNYAQNQIVYLLSRNNKGLCVVGDDAQSIYGFRGAQVDNILEFMNTFEGARLFKLEQNYRSTETIVNAANSLIDHNMRQIKKNIFSKRKQGDSVKVFYTYSDMEEAHQVARQLEHLHAVNEVDYNEMAVLYRTNSQSRVLEEVFRKLGLPYKIWKGLSFYQRAEIKNVIAYMRLCVNPNDEEAIRRIINYPTRGIGNTTLSKLVSRAIASGQTIWQVLEKDMDSLDVHAGTRSKLEAFRDMILDFIQTAREKDAATVTNQILKDTGIWSELQHSADPENISRKENVEELLNGTESFVIDRSEEGLDVSLSAYLNEICLLSDSDENNQDGFEDQSVISLMTVHSSKGLEFRAVFVVGLEEELFPSLLSIGNPRELEEERRLLYVAMTRAKDYLMLSCASNRFRYGKLEAMRPSRFLMEIDPKYVVEMGHSSRSMSSRRSTYHTDSQAKAIFKPSFSSNFKKPVLQPSTRQPAPRFKKVSPASAGSQDAAMTQGPFSVGQRVLHARFGQGVIRQIEGSGIDAKATVEFDQVGVKHLLLRFAKLSLLS